MPNSSIIDVFKTLQYFLVLLSYNFLSIDKKTPENAFIPSITMFRVMGIRKLSMRNMVKKIKVAMYIMGSTFDC